MPRPRCAILVAGFLLIAGPARAVVGGEPGSCDPPCRSGFMCKAGKCVSLCNPPCGTGERCVKGECELLTRKGTPQPKDNYLAVMGGGELALNGHAWTGTAHAGEVRVEFGGRYTTFQVGPVFRGGVTSIRAALLGHVPFRPYASAPLFLVPTISLGYSFGWASDVPPIRNPKIQDIFIAPGLRIRYDLVPRLALLVDVIQVQINFVRLFSSSGTDVERMDAVPVSYNLAAGLAFLY